MSAPPAAGTREAMRKDPAGEVLAQIPLDEVRDGIPVRFGLPDAREPGLPMLLNQFVLYLLKASHPCDSG